jgi:signal transduction histidine kinase/ActR/RegA family two-component response regulator
MSIIARWAEHPLPIDAADRIGAVRRRFLDEPELAALPVLSDGRPAGVALRAVVMAIAEDPLTDQSPISRLTARARTLEAGAPAAECLAMLLSDGGGAEPVMLVDGEAYVGLVTQASMARALEEAGQASPPPVREADAEAQARFVEMLSREVRTPMSGVLAVTELLQRQPLTSDAQAYVKTIVHAAETVVRVLDDALDLALGESGRLEPSLGAVSLRQAMDEIQADWQARERSNVAVLVSYDGDPDLGVRIDGGRLRQVFSNLISAAVKNTRQGAVEASLKARVLPEGVRLEGRVRDAGPGLPAEQLAQIFDPMSGSQDGRIGWSGLGPALCRRIVEAMDGSIRAESNVGEGVTVTFELTAAKLEEEAPDELASERTGPASGLHVLVVDDNATNRMVAEGLCEMFDCTSETAEDGVEAVEAARSGRFDLILMDIKMPRMDGVEATKAIRDLPAPIGQTPIIALTANADPEDAKTYIACGMSSVVEKPIKPERLLSAMNAALEGRQPSGDASVQAA